MIVTCPKCAARFNLPAEKLAPDGKNVKCTSCAESWFQLPDPEELGEFEDFERIAEEIEKDMAAMENDIPSAVRPDQGRFSGESPFTKMPVPLVNRLSGYAAALVVWIVITAFFTLLHTPIVKAWPASYYAFNLLGIETQIDGEGLVFDKLKANIEQHEETIPELHIAGEIINLKSDVQGVPMIEASARNDQGAVISVFHIRPPESSVDGEGSIPFEATFPIGDLEVTSVQVRFTL